MWSPYFVAGFAYCHCIDWEPNSQMFWRIANILCKFFSQELSKLSKVLAKNHKSKFIKKPNVWESYLTFLIDAVIFL